MSCLAKVAQASRWSTHYSKDGRFGCYTIIRQITSNDKNDREASWSTDTVDLLNRELDNKSENRRKAEEFQNLVGKDKPISKKLLKCRSTKEFMKYAESKGATVTINSNHVKISKYGVTTGFQSAGRKTDFKMGVLKQKIIAFQAMGIAWDDCLNQDMAHALKSISSLHSKGKFSTRLLYLQSIKLLTKNLFLFICTPLIVQTNGFIVMILSIIQFLDPLIKFSMSFIS